MKLYRGGRISYKPFNYPWAFDFFQVQSELFWVPGEIALQNDIQQWNSRLTKSERHLLEEVQKFLASADTDVAGVYCDKYIPKLPLPEIRSALLSIANIEAVHQQSYALTIDTLGMSESAYSAFLEIPEMLDKHIFLTKKRSEDLNEIDKFLLDIAICSGFGEGMQLFSAFAIFMSFKKRGLMSGLGQLTSFIARDEDLHCQFMLKIFNTIREEEESSPVLDEHIYTAAQEAVRLEEHFIDLAFSMGDIEGLTTGELKEYIRYVTDKRLKQMNLRPVYGVQENPLLWMDEQLGLGEYANFFETRSSSYSRVNYSGSWTDAWAKFDAKRLGANNR